MKRRMNGTEGIEDSVFVLSIFMLTSGPLPKFEIVNGSMYRRNPIVRGPDPVRRLGPSDKDRGMVGQRPFRISGRPPASLSLFPSRQLVPAVISPARPKQKQHFYATKKLRKPHTNSRLVPWLGRRRKTDIVSSTRANQDHVIGRVQSASPAW